MGFDNECILNIESLAGEYFCPVCRTLVYPQEAVQAQCTHLYCKPCLSYVVSSTQACPYDGYLVTEASSKPLMESNKVIAETIGKTTVHCLYHRSGCVWQGPLSDCTPHCASCAFGNSPVVCNRCGIQIVHRQVQEHAQTCNVNGTNSQPQVAETAQDAGVTVDQSKIVNQAVAPTSQPQTIAAQPPTLNPVPQTMPATAMSAPDQQYYQQYYQQYPGYDPYQQAYQQQYYPYQQPPPQQVQPQSQPPQQVQQVQAPIPQVQPQAQAQAQPQIPPNGQPQPVYPQPVGQVNPQPYVQPVAHGHMPPVQSYSQVQPHMQVPQYQQMHPSQPPQVIPQAPPHLHYQPHQQMQPTPPPHQQMQPAPQPHQQTQTVPPQQHPMQVQQSGPVPPGQMPAQFPPPPPHMRPPQPPHMLPAQPSLPAHQHTVMHQVQQPIPQQYMQQPQLFSGQLSGQFQSQPPHTVPYPQQHSQIRPPGPPQPMQQPPLGFVQPQQGPALPHGMPPHPSQGYVARPALPPQARPPQFGPNPPSVNQSNVTMVNQPHVYPDQEPNQHAPPLGQQEDKSPSLKNTEPVANDIGPNFIEVKPESGEQNHAEVDQMKKEELTKDTVSDSATTQRVKEESKDGVLDQNKADDVKQEETSQTDNGSSQGQTSSQTLATNKGNEHGRSPHAPYGHPGQQQRPDQTQGQPPRPPGHGHGYMPHGSHPGEHFQPPGPNQPGPFQPEGPFGGPPGPGPNRGYESQSSRFLHAPVEPDLYQNQRPLNYDNRRPDSSHYGPPYNGGPPPGVEFPPTRHHETGDYKSNFKQFPGPPYMGREDSPRFRDHSSRFLDKAPHGYGGRFDDNRQQNPEFHGPMHGFGRHHSPNPFGGPHGNGREMERHPFGERFPMGHMHRREFDGGSFQDYGPSRESNQPFGESFGSKSRRPHLGEPGFRSSYSRQAFPNDGGFYAGGPDLFDPLRKRKSVSMGWCRICKVDCESVEGLDMHGQTREHQRMAMDMVISIKQKNSKNQKTSNEREEGRKFRDSYTC